ncbi:hypothetical protein KQX54_005692 [Cotesia glomerata]|uniref:Uncharacterized protein n=1 Tax=Cotesia glomerata TaxID=32391 RepID=A0AAV7HPJ9_COTGL|nr:hypothetical protein KQX54_005692 [Cotesia glomerata]
MTFEFIRDIENQRVKDCHELETQRLHRRKVAIRPVRNALETVDQATQTEFIGPELDKTVEELKEHDDFDERLIEELRTELELKQQQLKKRDDGLKQYKLQLKKKT